MSPDKIKDDKHNKDDEEQLIHRIQNRTGESHEAVEKAIEELRFFCY